MKKSLLALYNGAYQAAIKRQLKRGCAPTPEPNGEDVCKKLQELVDAGTITEDDSRKLASAFGNLEYGEWGLTHARMEAPLRKQLGDRYSWLIHREFQSAAPHGRH